MKQIYWKDNCHFYKIIKRNCVIAIGYSAIDKENYDAIKEHYLFIFIKQKKVVKSTKTEFINAYHKAIKKIGIKT